MHENLRPLPSAADAHGCKLQSNNFDSHFVCVLYKRSFQMHSGLIDAFQETTYPFADTNSFF